MLLLLLLWIAKKIVVIIIVIEWKFPNHDFLHARRTIVQDSSIASSKQESTSSGGCGRSGCRTNKGRGRSTGRCDRIVVVVGVATASSQCQTFKDLFKKHD